MRKFLISTAVAFTTVAAIAGGTAIAQQATTGENQSNPRANQQSGPVGTTNPGAPMTRPTMRSNDTNMNSSAAPAPAASDNMNMRNERPARADRG